MKVSMVPPEHVHNCWEYVQPYMEMAAKQTYGRFHEEDIFDLVSQRPDHHLWVAFESMVYNYAMALIQDMIQTHEVVDRVCFHYINESYIVCMHL